MNAVLRPHFYAVIQKKKENSRYRLRSIFFSYSGIVIVHTHVPRVIQFLMHNEKMGPFDAHRKKKNSFHFSIYLIHLFVPQKPAYRNMLASSTNFDDIGDQPRAITWLEYEILSFFSILSLTFYRI